MGNHIKKEGELSKDPWILDWSLQKAHANNQNKKSKSKPG